MNFLKCIKFKHLFLLFIIFLCISLCSVFYFDVTAKADLAENEINTTAYSGTDINVKSQANVVNVDSLFGEATDNFLVLPGKYILRTTTQNIQQLQLVEQTTNNILFTIPYNTLTLENDGVDLHPESISIDFGENQVDLSSNKKFYKVSDITCNSNGEDIAFEVKSVSESNKQISIEFNYYSSTSIIKAEHGHVETAVETLSSFNASKYLSDKAPATQTLTYNPKYFSSEVNFNTHSIYSKLANSTENTYFSLVAPNINGENQTYSFIPDPGYKLSYIDVHQQNGVVSQINTVNAQYYEWQGDIDYIQPYFDEDDPQPAVAFKDTNVDFISGDEIIYPYGEIKTKEYHKDDTGYLTLSSIDCGGDLNFTKKVEDGYDIDTTYNLNLPENINTESVEFTYDESLLQCKDEPFYKNQHQIDNTFTFNFLQDCPKNNRPFISSKLNLSSAFLVEPQEYGTISMPKEAQLSKWNLMPFGSLHIPYTPKKSVDTNSPTGYIDTDNSLIINDFVLSDTPLSYKPLANYGYAVTCWKWNHPNDKGDWVEELLYPGDKINYSNIEIKSYINPQFEPVSVNIDLKTNTDVISADKAFYMTGLQKLLEGKNEYVIDCNVSDETNTVFSFYPKNEVPTPANIIFQTFISEEAKKLGMSIYSWELTPKEGITINDLSETQTFVITENMEPIDVKINTPPEGLPYINGKVSFCAKTTIDCTEHANGKIVPPAGLTDTVNVLPRAKDKSAYIDWDGNLTLFSDEEILTDNVTYSAVPKSGSSLKYWTVTFADGTTKQLFPGDDFNITGATYFEPCFDRELCILKYNQINWIGTENLSPITYSGEFSSTLPKYKLNYNNSSSNNILTFVGLNEGNEIVYSETVSWDVDTDNIENAVRVILQNDDCFSFNPEITYLDSNTPTAEVKINNTFTEFSHILFSIELQSRVNMLNPEPNKGLLTPGDEAYKDGFSFSPRKNTPEQEDNLTIATLDATGSFLTIEDKLNNNNYTYTASSDKYIPKWQLKYNTNTQETINLNFNDSYVLENACTITLKWENLYFNVFDINTFGQNLYSKNTNFGTLKNPTDENFICEPVLKDFKFPFEIPTISLIQYDWSGEELQTTYEEDLNYNLVEFLNINEIYAHEWMMPAFESPWKCLLYTDDGIQLKQWDDSAESYIDVDYLILKWEEEEEEPLQNIVLFDDNYRAAKLHWGLWSWVKVKTENNDEEKGTVSKFDEGSEDDPYSAWATCLNCQYGGTIQATSDGKLVVNDPVVVGDEPEYTATATATAKEGYKLKKWIIHDQCNLGFGDIDLYPGDDPINIQAGCTVEAIWEPATSKKDCLISTDIETGQETWGYVNKRVNSVPEGTAVTVQEDGSIVFTANKDEKILTPVPAKWEGKYIYSFDGWTTENGDVPEIITADTKFIAKFKKDVAYTINAVVKEGQSGWGTVSTTSIKNVPEGTKISYSADNKTITIGEAASKVYGTITAEASTATAQYTYAFDKWTDQPTSVTSDITLEANFTREGKIIEVKLVVNDEVNNDHNTDNNGIEMVLWEKYGLGYFNNALCDEDSRITSVNVPTKEGFTFNGYFTDKEGKGIQFVDKNGILETTYTLFDEGTENYAYAHWIQNPVPPEPTPEPQEPEYVSSQTSDSIGSLHILMVLGIFSISVVYITLSTKLRKKNEI